MIGYSDSAKDSGPVERRLGALYRAQEEIIVACRAA